VRHVGFAGGFEGGLETVLGFALIFEKGHTLSENSSI
jgi:hypothetical protein